MIFDILEEKLRVGLDLVTGETLFRNYTPPEVQVAVMTRMPLEGIAIDPYMPDWYRGQLQVIVRHTNPFEGERMANKVSSLLLVKTKKSFSASSERGVATISLFIPESLPVRFPRLAGNGFEWSTKFTTAFTFEPLN